MASLKRPQNFIDYKALPSHQMLQQIGRLAIVIAGIEDLIHGIIWLYLGVNDATGSLITGRWKIRQLQVECIKLLDSLGAPQSIICDLKEIFREIEKSAQIRNQCVHWIWNRPSGGRGGVHRLEPPVYQQDRESIYFTAKQISDITDDLVWLEARLYPHAISVEQVYAAIRADGPDEIPTPWLCIFPQPVHNPI